MAVHKDNHLMLKPFDVIRYGDAEQKIWVVLDPGDTNPTRIQMYVKLAPVMSDGTIGIHKDFSREDVINKAQYIDGSQASIQVSLPVDVQKQLQEYEKELHEERYRKEEEEPRYHPSYGSIHLHRYSGYAKLFMSPFHHENFIGISISRASMNRSLSEDHMHGDVREIIEVFLSEAQFARFITSSFDGDGTPCTLHNVTGMYMPEPPYEDEKEKFHKDVRREADHAAANLHAAVVSSEVLLTKKSVTKKDLAQVLEYLQRAEKDLSDSMPFTLLQMQERMDKIVAQAGIEVEAHVNQLARKIGMESLTKQNTPIKFLEDPRLSVPRLCTHCKRPPSEHEPKEATCPDGRNIYHPSNS